MLDASHGDTSPATWAAGTTGFAIGVGLSARGRGFDALARVTAFDGVFVGDAVSVDPALLVDALFACDASVFVDAFAAASLAGAPWFEAPSFDAPAAAASCTETGAPGITAAAQPRQDQERHRSQQQ